MVINALCLYFASGFTIPCVACALVYSLLTHSGGDVVILAQETGARKAATVKLLVRTRLHGRGSETLGRQPRPGVEAEQRGRAGGSTWTRGAGGGRLVRSPWPSEPRSLLSVCPSRSTTVRSDVFAVGVTASGRCAVVPSLARCWLRAGEPRGFVRYTARPRALQPSFSGSGKVIV